MTLENLEISFEGDALEVKLLCGNFEEIWNWKIYAKVIYLAWKLF